MSRFDQIYADYKILAEIKEIYERMPLIELLGELNELQATIRQYGLRPMRQLFLQNLNQEVNKKLQ